MEEPRPEARAGRRMPQPRLVIAAVIVVALLGAIVATVVVVTAPTPDNQFLAAVADHPDLSAAERDALERRSGETVDLGRRLCDPVLRSILDQNEGFVREGLVAQRALTAPQARAVVSAAREVYCP